jgi:hypothetical protein
MQNSQIEGLNDALRRESEFSSMADQARFVLDDRGAGQSGPPNTDLMDGNSIRERS